MTITDEMVEKLVTTLSQSLRGWDDKPFEQLTPADWQRAGRAALEVVVPMIVAQWLREESSKYIVELGMIFHARANELDPHA